jgi:hypothetical protein
LKFLSRDALRRRQILPHLRTCASRSANSGPRKPPSTRALASRGTARAARSSADPPPVT